MEASPATGKRGAPAFILWRTGARGSDSLYQIHAHTKALVCRYPCKHDTNQAPLASYLGLVRLQQDFHICSMCLQVSRASSGPRQSDSNFTLENSSLQWRQGRKHTVRPEAHLANQVSGLRQGNRTHLILIFIVNGFFYTLYSDQFPALSCSQILPTHSNHLPFILSISLENNKQASKELIIKQNPTNQNRTEQTNKQEKRLKGKYKKNIQLWRHTEVHIWKYH